MTNRSNSPNRSRKKSAIQLGGFVDKRGRLLSWFILTGFVIVSARSIMLHIFPDQQASLLNIADHQYSKEIELSPYRGNIYDRRGEPMAISVRKPSIAINPRVFNPSKISAKKLAKILETKSSDIRKLAKKKSYFAWLRRHVTESQADQIKNLNLDGMFILREHGRYYPSGKFAANLLGFIGIDNKGLGGLEHYFERDLKGQKLTVRPSLDAHGNPIYSDGDSAQPEKMGHSVYLTIDKVIQEIAEEELERGVKNAKAKKGYAIVSDPHTGRVLAVANYPSFDPNYPRKVNVKKTRNSALLDVFEPGSVTKPFVIAHALEKNLVRKNSHFDCENGSMKIGRQRIRDTHKAGVLPLDQVIVQSSNICMYKIARKIGPEATWNALAAFGFGTGHASVHFPGVERGWISKWENWRQMRFANIAFGQGFTTTALELVQAAGVIANGGTLLKPSIVDRIVSSDGVMINSMERNQGTRVISPEVAVNIRNVMQLVVTHKEGTGSKAATQLFSVAGKTGTAQKTEPGKRGYAKDKYLTSFLGFTPVKDPYLVIHVAVDEPTVQPFYGGAWAAPIFSQIAERSLKYLNVAPDIVDPGKATISKGTKSKNGRPSKG